MSMHHWYGIVRLVRSCIEYIMVFMIPYDVRILCLDLFKNGLRALELLKYGFDSSENECVGGGTISLLAIIKFYE